MIAVLSDYEDTIIGMLPEQTEQLKQTATKIGTQKIDLMINQFSELTKIIRYRKERRALLEVTIVRLCRILNSNAVTELEERVKNIKKELDELRSEKDADNYPI